MADKFTTPHICVFVFGFVVWLVFLGLLVSLFGLFFFCLGFVCFVLLCVFWFFFLRYLERGEPLVVTFLAIQVFFLRLKASSPSWSF